MPHYSICSIEPVKRGRITKRQVHDQRQFSHVRDNVDPERGILNRVLIGESLRSDLLAAIGDLKMAREGKDPDNDDVAAEMVLSFSPGWVGLDGPMTYERALDILENDQFREWLRRSSEWLKKRGCTTAVLHMDEATPHIHAIVPAIVENQAKRSKKGQYLINYNQLYGFESKQIFLIARTKNLAKRRELEEQFGIKYEPRKTKVGRVNLDYAACFSDMGLVPGEDTIDNPAEHVQSWKYKYKSRKQAEDMAAADAEIAAEVAAAKAEGEARVEAAREAARRMEEEVVNASLAVRAKRAELAKKRAEQEKERKRQKREDERLAKARARQAEEEAEIARRQDEITEIQAIIDDAARRMAEVEDMNRDLLEELEDSQRVLKMRVIVLRRKHDSLSRKKLQLIEAKAELDREIADYIREKEYEKAGLVEETEKLKKLTESLGVAVSDGETLVGRLEAVGKWTRDYAKKRAMDAKTKAAVAALGKSARAAAKAAAPKKPQKPDRSWAAIYAQKRRADEKARLAAAARRPGKGGQAVQNAGQKPGM